jgi:uncharacterized protein (TIGR03435 family)
MKSWLVCVWFVLISLAPGQQPAERPAFEVASIKSSDPNPSNAIWIGMSADAGMVRYTNITLKDCIRAAYRVRDFQIQGPDWINDARFEITAKLPPATSQDQIPEMLQVLLAERFKLTLRRDMKVQSVYALIAGKGQPTLKPAAAETKPDSQTPTAVGPDGKPRPPMMIALLPSGGVHLWTPSASLASFVELMSRFTERPVVDMTGVTGQFNLDLTFAPETIRGVFSSDRTSREAVSEPVPSIFDAVQQYGLQLEARKAPIELLTVTHLEKTPTAN